MSKVPELHCRLALSYGLASCDCDHCLWLRIRYPGDGFVELSKLYSNCMVREDCAETRFNRRLTLSRQGTLMTMAIVVFSLFFNTIGAKHLPLFESLILFLHVFGFFAIIIPLWVLAPKVSHLVHVGRGSRYLTTALSGTCEGGLHQLLELWRLVICRCCVPCWTTHRYWLLGRQ